MKFHLLNYYSNKSAFNSSLQIDILQPNLLDASVQNFIRIYNAHHIPLTIIVSILSLLTNACTMVVLTRKHMLQPASVILISLASCMIANSTAQIILLSLEAACTHNVNIHCERLIWFLPKGRGTIDNIVVMHTLLMTMIRYVALRHPMISKFKCRVPDIVCYLGVIYIVTIILSVPMFLGFNVCPEHISLGFQMCYEKWVEGGILQYNYYFIGIALKLLPCAVILIFSILFLIHFQQYKQKQPFLLLNQTTTNTGGFPVEEATPSRQERIHLLINRIVPEARRRTLANPVPIAAAIVIQLLVQTPQGVLNILTAHYGFHFQQQVESFEKFIAFLSDVSNLLLFAAYCLTNPQFRATTRQFVLKRKLDGNATRFSSALHFRRGALKCATSFIELHDNLMKRREGYQETAL